MCWLLVAVLWVLISSLLCFCHVAKVPGAFAKSTGPPPVLSPSPGAIPYSISQQVTELREMWFRFPDMSEFQHQQKKCLATMEMLRRQTLQFQSVPKCIVETDWGDDVFNDFSKSHDVPNKGSILGLRNSILPISGDMPNSPVFQDAQPRGECLRNWSGFPSDDRAPKRPRLGPLVGTVPIVGVAEPVVVPSSDQSGPSFGLFLHTLGASTTLERGSWSEVSWWSYHWNWRSSKPVARFSSELLRGTADLFKKSALFFLYQQSTNASRSYPDQAISFEFKMLMRMACWLRMWLIRCGNQTLCVSYLRQGIFPKRR